MRTFEGNVVAENNMRIGIVAARFNEFITSKLVAGAQDALRRHNVSEEDVDVAWVPGAFEIPLIASEMAKCGKYDAVIAWVQLSVEAQAIMIMCAARFRKESPRFLWQAACRLCSVC